ncbi:MAG: dienelactone hydrolase family protein [Gemmatimonadota bacterium]
MRRSSLSEGIDGHHGHVPANGHSTLGYLSLPSTGNGPRLLVVQEWWGLVDHIKWAADRFAALGFVALAPDFYDGRQAKSPDEAGKLFMTLNIDRAGADLRGAADYVLALPAVTSTRVGTLGFRMGGQLALYAAVEYPERIGAAVDFYGIHPKVPIDPAKLKVPVLGHLRLEDPSVNEADARALVDRLRAGAAEASAFFYATGHAFFNDTRPEAYSEKDAAAAWQRSADFLKKHLA